MLPCTGNPLGFLDWVSLHENATTKMFANILLIYVWAIYFFKIGVRNNNLNNAAHLKFDLFYAFNHPIYREVEYRDLKNCVLYPEEVRAVCDKNMLYSEYSNKGKSQGGNFILEGKVKRQKLLAPKGPVKASTWAVLARCF